ncbi:hypothetical protein [Cardiobacterium hominis]|uniref:hypothetical protein n=1 Tax=Cardiobacterium hominis TaxID=2718 RepID=UPI00391F611E
MQAGLAGVHGNVSSFGSANGISVVALADFGKPGVGGVDGSSGATGKSSSGGSASINNDEDKIEDDDLLALLEGDEDAERSPKNTDKSDMYGKTLKTAVARVQNSGSVSGSITARAQQLKRPLNKNSYTPQFYDVSLITSGNGVSMANYIETRTNTPIPKKNRTTSTSAAWTTAAACAVRPPSKAAPAPPTPTPRAKAAATASRSLPAPAALPKTPPALRWTTSITTAISADKSAKSPATTAATTRRT